MLCGDNRAETEYGLNGKQTNDSDERDINLS